MASRPKRTSTITHIGHPFAAAPRVSNGWVTLAVTLSLSGILASPAVTTAGVITADNTRIQTYESVVFETEDQSIWDPKATGAGEIKVDWELTQSQWKKFIGRPVTARIGVGQIIEECVLGVCGKAGVAAGLKAEAYFLPYFNAKLTPGTFDATAAFKPTVEYQASGLGTDFSKLKTDSGLTDSAHTRLVVKPPSIKVDTGLNIKTELSLFAEACAVGCAIDESIAIPDLSTNFKLPLVQINTKIDPATGKGPTLKIFNPPTNSFEAKQELISVAATVAGGGDFAAAADSFLYDDLSDLLFEKVRDRLAETDPDVKNATTQAEKDRLIKKRKEGIQRARTSKLATSPIVGSFNNPYLEDIAAGLSGDALSTTIGGELANVALDVDRILGTALGLPNGGSLSLAQLGVPSAAVSAEITLGDIKVGPVLDIKTELTVKPELMVHLEFDAPVLIKGQIGRQTSYTGSWEDLPDIALLAPEGKLEFDPKQDSLGTIFNDNASGVSATPSFFVESTVTNNTFLNVKARAEVELFSAEVKIPGFGTESIPPLFKETKETGSLARVELYKNTFESNNWVESEDGDARYTPTEASFISVADSATSTSPTINDGSLSFSAAGEVVFQARRKFGVSQVREVAQADPRVNENLNTRRLIQDIAELQPYGDNIFGDSGLNPSDPFAALFPVLTGYDLENGSTAERVFLERLQVESGQIAQVMRDGRLDVNTDFTVEAGGTLELGADPQILSGFLAKDRGVINTSKMTVHGTVYSKGSAEKEAIYAQSGSLSDAHAFVNQGELHIGQTGNLKADGAFQNTGEVTNYGALELTSADAQSTGTIHNGYGGELDVFGSLSAVAIDNRAQVTAHKGATLLLENKDSSTPGQFSNLGELVVDDGALVRLAGANGSVRLNNNFLIENRGLIENQSGGVIFNGNDGTDWQAWVDVDDVAGVARVNRKNKLQSFQGTSGSVNLESALEERNLRVLEGVFDSELKRRQFISAANESISGLRAAAGDAGTNLRTALSNLKSLTEQRDETQAVVDSCGSLFSVKCINARSRLLAENAQLGNLEGAFNTSRDTALSAVRTAKRVGLAGGFADALAKERAYGASVDSLEALRGEVNFVLALLDSVADTDSDSGFGYLHNASGGLLLNDSAIVNTSILENDFGGAVYNGALFLNSGLFRNKGELTNQDGAALLSAGGYVVNGLEDVGSAGLSTIVNLGNWTNRNGVILNHDTLNNHGLLDNTLVDSVILNHGNLSNLGEVRNAGSIGNEAGAGLNNDALITNDGSISNRGVFNNGRRADLADGEAGLSVAEFNQRANTVYAQRQAAAEARVLLPRLATVQRGYDYQRCGRDVRELR